MASQFSRDGRHFAHLTADGKLKVWQTATSTFEQEFTPDFHLTSPCTCLQFVQPDGAAQNHSPRKKKRRESLPATDPLVALGTSTGYLLFYSISKADLDFTLNSETGQAVSSIAWDDVDLVYAAVDQNIVSWDLSKRTIKSKWKAGKEKVTAILVVPEQRIVTASRGITLWDVRKQEVLKTFTGHKNEVSVLRYISSHNSPTGYLISGSTGDRLLSVWGMGDGLREITAVAALRMIDIPLNVSIQVSEDVTSVAVAVRSGDVHFYQKALNGKRNKPLNPKATMQIVSDTRQNNARVTPIPVLGVYLHDDLSLTVCYGNDVKLIFENLLLNDYEKNQCFIRNDPRRAKEAKQDRIAKIRTPVADERVRYLTPHVSSDLVKRKGDGIHEVPMEKRLENLALNKVDRASQVPKMDNVAQLLVQALHSKDKKMLRNVLHQRDENVVRNTVKRLPMPVTLPLLQEIMGLIQGKTLMSAVGARWLKYLLQIHAGLLVSNPDLTDLLSPIMGTIESRISLLTPLNRLKGRLDLLVSQMAPSADAVEDAPALVFNDKDASDSSSDDVEFPPVSESDNEWAEESEDEEEEEEEDDSDVEMV